MLSIIIQSPKTREHLINSLNSLMKQERTFDMEIISYKKLVPNDIEGILDRFNTIMVNRQETEVQTKNKMIHAAKGDILLFQDESIIYGNSILQEFYPRAKKDITLTCEGNKKEGTINDFLPLYCTSRNNLNKVGGADEDFHYPSKYETLWMLARLSNTGPMISLDHVSYSYSPQLEIKNMYVDKMMALYNRKLERATKLNKWESGSGAWEKWS